MPSNVTYLMNDAKTKGAINMSDIDHMCINDNITIKLKNGLSITLEDADIRLLQDGIDSYFAAKECNEFIAEKIKSNVIHPDILEDENFLNDFRDIYDDHYHHTDDNVSYELDERQANLESAWDELDEFDRKYTYDFEFRNEFKSFLLKINPSYDMSLDSVNGALYDIRGQVNNDSNLSKESLLQPREERT